MLQAIDWLLLSAIILLAGIVRGCIGFGFSALVVASGMLLVPPAILVALVAVLEIVASIHMAFSTWRQAALKPLFYLLIGTTITTPFGVMALVLLPTADIRLLLNSIILCLSLLLMSGWQYRGKVSPLCYILLGLVSGVCNGAAAVGGLPVATFLASIKLSIQSLRATLVLFFFFAGIIFILSASGHGIYSHSLLILCAVMALPMSLGVYIGSLLFEKFNDKVLRKAVVLLLLAISLIGLMRELLNLL